MLQSVYYLDAKIWRCTHAQYDGAEYYPLSDWNEYDTLLAISRKTKRGVWLTAPCKQSPITEQSQRCTLRQEDYQPSKQAREEDIRMRERGFTITELMIVVAIMGGLTAVATPSISRWLTSIRMESATREVASTLQLARVKAITQNTSIRINFDTAANVYQMQQRNSANLAIWNNVDKAKKLPAGIRFVSVTGNPVTFQSGRGSTLPGSNSTITLQNTQGKSNAVVVAQTGRVLIRKN